MLLAVGPQRGTVAAYVAAAVAFAYAVASLYWAVGGHALVSTVGGYAEQFARQGGAIPVLIALAAAVAKVIGACSPSLWAATATHAVHPA